MGIFIILVIVIVIIGFFSSKHESCNKELQGSYSNNIKTGAYSLKLIEPGDNIIALLKIIRECTNLGLKEAKDIIDNFPTNILENIDYLEAIRLKEDIEKTGAKVELINVNVNINNELYIIKSPMVGTFYNSLSPKKPPFVEIGMDIKKGDTVCLIESKMLMNEIKSDESGIVEQIFVNDGSQVNFGTPLFAIRLNNDSLNSINNSCVISSRLHESENNTIFEILIDESDCEETDDEDDENYIEEEVYIEESLCNGCNACVKVCPKKAIDEAFENDPASIDYGKCDTCKICVNSCPNKAIYVDR